MLSKSALGVRQPQLPLWIAGEAFPAASPLFSLVVIPLRLRLAGTSSRLPANTGKRPCATLVIEKHGWSRVIAVVTMLQAQPQRKERKSRAAGKAEPFRPAGGAVP